MTFLAVDYNPNQFDAAGEGKVLFFLIHVFRHLSGCAAFY